MKKGVSIMKRYILVIGGVGVIVGSLIGCDKKGEAKVQPAEVQTAGQLL